MPDDVTLVESLHRDLRDVQWLEPETIRATARRRSRRTAALAAVSVVVVAALAATVVDRTGAPQPPAAGALGGYAEIPVEAMLTPEDVPVPTGEQLRETALDEPVRVDDVLQVCARAQGLPAEEPRSRYSRGQTTLGMPPSPSSQSGAVLTQDVYRMEAGAARRFFGDLERTVKACGAWPTRGRIYTERGTVEADVVRSWRITASGFAGDQAVLLRHTVTERLDRATVEPPGHFSYFRLVVRVGDLVTVLVPTPSLSIEVPGTGLSEAQLLAMARVAAERMCVAANPGC
ncbi:hypothetical protein ACH495_05130 [Micromonospora sp. NPDC018662]|uniref:hypothetical protein n=1 Tax=Micromonospora sp. NPDC018662 TaxID=3364238 RepID=UPI00379E77A8